MSWNKDASILRQENKKAIKWQGVGGRYSSNILHANGKQLTIDVYKRQGKYDDAIKAYTAIKDKYFRSYQAMDIDKYIEQAKLLKK